MSTGMVGPRNVDTKHPTTNRYVRLLWALVFLILTFAIIALEWYGMDIQNDETFGTINFIAGLLCILLFILGVYYINRAYKGPRGVRYHVVSKVRIFGYALIASLVVVSVTILILIWNVQIAQDNCCCFIVFPFIMIFFISNIFKIQLSGSVRDYYIKIISMHGHDAKGNGFVNIWEYYKTSIVESSQMKDWLSDLYRYCQILRDEALIVSYERVRDTIVIYLPSPTLVLRMETPFRLEFLSHKSFMKIQHICSNIMIHKNGGLFFRLIDTDYKLIGKAVTPATFYKTILKAFDRSIRFFLKGNERGAIEAIGGRGHCEKRRRRFISNAALQGRFIVMSVVIVIFMSVSPIQQDLKAIDKDYTWSLGPDYHSFGIGLSTAKRPFQLSREVSNGQEFILEFKSNRTVQSAGVVEYIPRFFDDNKIVYITEELTQVDHGVFRFKIEKSSLSSFYSFKIEWRENHSSPSVKVHITLTQLKAKSPLNTVCCGLSLGIYSVVEAVIWKRYKDRPLTKI